MINIFKQISSKKIKKAGALLLIFCLAVIPMACADQDIIEETGEQQDKQYDPLQIYVAYGDPEGIMNAFTESTGIPAEYIDMSSGEVLSRMRAEKGRPLGDVWFGGGIDSFMVAAEEGLLHPYISPEAQHVDEMFKDPDGYWTGVSITIITFVVNTLVAEEQNIPIPRTWEDLLDPIYNEEISVANPGISGSTYTAIASILQRMGEEEGWKYIAEINKNIPYYADTGSEPGQKASIGDVLLGVAPNGVWYEMEGYPVVTIYPEDGTPWQHAPVAVIEGTENLEAAKKFVDWTLSVEGQEVLAQASPRPGIRPNIKLQEGVPSLDDINIVDYDFKEAADRRDEIIEKWNDIVK